MRPHTLPLALVAILSGPVLFGQALMDHAAAVTGATAGVAGGKIVSDALTRILQSTADQTARPAQEPSKKQSKTSADAEKEKQSVVAAPKAAARGVASFAPAPAPLPPAVRHTAEPRAALPVGQPSFSRYESPTPQPPLTAAQLRSIASGASRADVIGTVGTPAAQITMDDNGHLVEIFQYTANGSRLGSVRLTDGRVESVNAPQ